MKRTYDKCPMCGVVIPYGALYETFVNEADYSLDFTVKCLKCKGRIIVDVETVPEFSMTAEVKP